jgi:O-antigen ligase
MSPKITNSANNHSEHRAAFGFFLGLIVWAPLPFGSNILWSEMLLALACFLLTALVLISDLRAERSPYVNRVALIPFLILVSAQVYLLIQLSFPEISSLGFVGTIEPFSTQIQLLSGLALCSAFYLTLKTVTTGKRTVWFLGAIVVSGLLQATYGSVMTLSGLEYGFFIEKIVNQGNATGTFINRNHLAGYLVLSLACGIGLMISSFKRGKYAGLRAVLRDLLDTILSGKGALRISLIVMVIGLVLTRSRMGNISFFVGLALAGLGVMLYSRVSKKTIAFFLASILVIDALIISSFFDLNELAQRLEGTSTESENRDEIFKLSLPMVKDNLIFGTGAGTFYTNYPAYRDESAGSGFYMHAHNDYVEFLSERGIIGSLPLLAFFLIVFRQGMLLLRSSSMKKRGLAFTIIMSCAAIALHSVVDFNLQMPAYAFTLTAIWALPFCKPNLRSNQLGPSQES